VQLETFTTPEVALRPEQEAKVPPEALRVMVVVAVVTTLPAESSTLTTGSVARAEPEAPPTGWVVKTNLAADPKEEGEKSELVAVVRPEAEALNV
jgi:hypothetical protein